MVCKPINLINTKLDLEEITDAIVFFFMTIRQASIFDANGFCYQISQLIQLTRGNIPNPERFDQMIDIEQNTILRICPSKIYAATVKI